MEIGPIADDILKFLAKQRENSARSAETIKQLEDHVKIPRKPSSVVRGQHQNDAEQDSKDLNSSQ